MGEKRGRGGERERERGGEREGERERERYHYWQLYKNKILNIRFNCACLNTHVLHT